MLVSNIKSKSEIEALAVSIDAKRFSTAVSSKALEDKSTFKIKLAAKLALPEKVIELEEEPDKAEPGLIVNVVIEAAFPSPVNSPKQATIWSQLATAVVSARVSPTAIVGVAVLSAHAAAEAP